MNTLTATAQRHAADGKIGRLIQALRREMRRALELVGASYRNGPLAPL